tara:strand:+ start:442 stop:1152 length:711 start_codon:yes stop_codon:yes gene_type:complete
MKIIGIIPARLQSKRLVNKPLLEFNNKTLLQHTYEAVKKSSLFDQIYIATDSKLIQDTANNFNAEVIITSEKNKNGTERCIDVIKQLHKDINNHDLVINIQCDEPFIRKKHFEAIIKLMNSNVQIATLISPIKKLEFNDTNVVKVSVNKDFMANKFSRFHSKFDTKDILYKHIGIYAYKKKTLLELAKLKEVQIEIDESLEQLRWLKNNYIIHCKTITEELISINTIEDVKKVLKK